MHTNKSFEELNKKCLLLEKLGFTIEHRDCDVSYHTVGGQYKGFDFSATDSDVVCIIYTALKHVYSLGLEEGQRNVQQKMREALGIDE